MKPRSLLVYALLLPILLLVSVLAVRALVVDSNPCTDACDATLTSCLASAGNDADLQAICSIQHVTCTEGCATLEATTTEITSDKSDPSKPGKSVKVKVQVTGASTLPTGTVTITGADSPVTVPLDQHGKADGDVVFSAEGTCTLVATYNGDATHSGSSDSETHTVQPKH